MCGGYLPRQFRLLGVLKPDLYALVISKHMLMRFTRQVLKLADAS
jgi:hypothetical protein